jgi:hypothetical protein
MNATATHHQATCGCGWTGKVYSTKLRAEGSADVHAMVAHTGAPAVVRIGTTGAPLNGYIAAN